MNVHTPERQPHESIPDYRERRALSQRLVAYGLAPTNPKHFAVPIGKSERSRRDKHRARVAAAALRAGLLTTPKPLELRQRKPKKAIKPTWPRTFDQREQSRPLIVLGKNRERDAGKRTKPKSAVAKRMDRPHRVGLIDRGHAKLLRWFGGGK